MHSYRCHDMSMRTNFHLKAYFVTWMSVSYELELRNFNKVRHPSRSNNFVHEILCKPVTSNSVKIHDTVENNLNSSRGWESKYVLIPKNTYVCDIIYNITLLFNFSIRGELHNRTHLYTLTPGRAPTNDATAFDRRWNKHNIWMTGNTSNKASIMALSF
jgi:hypothetical protein